MKFILFDAMTLAIDWSMKFVFGITLQDIFIAEAMEPISLAIQVMAEEALISLDIANSAH
jgi:hypothetical protein